MSDRTGSREHVADYSTLTLPPEVLREQSLMPGRYADHHQARVRQDPEHGSLAGWNRREYSGPRLNKADELADVDLSGPTETERSRNEPYAPRLVPASATLIVSTASLPYSKFDDTLRDELPASWLH